MFCRFSRPLRGLLRRSLFRRLCGQLCGLHGCLMLRRFSRPLRGLLRRSLFRRLRCQLCGLHCCLTSRRFSRPLCSLFYCELSGSLCSLFYCKLSGSMCRLLRCPFRLALCLGGTLAFGRSLQFSRHLSVARCADPLALGFRSFLHAQTGDFPGQRSRGRKISVLCAMQIRPGIKGSDIVRSSVLVTQPFVI